MKNLKRADFYFGAFYSYLFTRKYNPVLIDESESSRHISICTNDNEYNLFAMYISEPTKITEEGNTFRWDFTFTENLCDIVENSKCATKENFIVFICGQKKLQDSEIFIVPYNKVFKCLGDDNINKNRRISLKVSKGENYVYCYGTALDRTNSYKFKRSIDDYLK